MLLRYVFAFRPFLDLYSSAPLERYVVLAFICRVLVVGSASMARRR